MGEEVRQKLMYMFRVWKLQNCIYLIYITLGNYYYIDYKLAEIFVSTVKTDNVLFVLKAPSWPMGIVSQNITSWYFLKGIL